MSIVSVKCDECGCTKQTFVKCDSCGRREPHTYCNVFPAGWYVVHISERIPDNMDKDVSSTLEIGNVLDKDACSLKCRNKILREVTRGEEVDRDMRLT